jgi:hypothetical protein
MRVGAGIDVPDLDVGVRHAGAAAVIHALTVNVRRVPVFLHGCRFEEIGQRRKGPAVSVGVTAQAAFVL